MGENESIGYKVSQFYDDWYKTDSGQDKAAASNCLMGVVVIPVFK